MAVRPIAYDPTGDATVLHDELGHTGAATFATVVFGRLVDGSVDSDVLIVACPVCGAVSCHPIGGGAAPGPVQKLFVRTVLRRAAALGIPVNQRTFAAIKVRVKARVLAMDGPDRWRLEAMQGEDDSVSDQ